MTGGGYVLRRVWFAVITMVAAVVLNFFLFRLAPGDPLAQFERLPNVSREGLDHLRHQYGIDDPILTQFWHYLQQLAHLDLGRSFQDSQPVLDVLWQAYKNTIPLVLAALTFAVVGGVLLGVLTAVRRGRATDHIGVGASLIFYAVPTQWLGLMLIFALSGVLPAGGRVDDFLIDPSPLQHQVDVARHLILPAFTLGIVILGQYALVTRAGMLETLGEDYILAARARGYSRPHIIRRHALRNALLPLSTLIALSLGGIASGAILTETVFSWPGIGRTTYTALTARDWPLLQGAFLFITLNVIIANLIADLLYAKLDPRVVR
jgi:ABC-type dipeptide/oligopeptide/nickel transport system permease component